MAFSFLVELLNMTMKNRQKKRRVVELNEPMLEYENTGGDSDDLAH
jgi:hypothetical protein